MYSFEHIFICMLRISKKTMEIVNYLDNCKTMRRYLNQADIFHNDQTSSHITYI